MNMFKKLSLKNKLALSASVAIVIGGMLVEALSYNASLNRLEVEVEQNLKGTVTAYNQYVTDWLVSKERSLTSLSSDIDKSNIVTHLEQVRHSAAFDNVFLAYPDGSQDNANGVVLPPGNDDPRKWGWYINAKKSPTKVFMDNPTVAAATGANVVSLGKAVNLAGQQVVLGADVEITDIVNGLSQVILPGSGYMFIMNDKGNIFTHPNTDLLNKPVNQLGVETSSIASATQGATNVIATIDGDKSVIHARQIPGTTLTTVAVVNYDSLVAPLNSAIWQQLIVTSIVVMVCIGLFSVLCNLLFQPLNNVSHALEQIANGNGDLTQRIKVESEDEVGKLANNFNIFVASLNELIGHIRTQSTHLDRHSQDSSQLAKRAVEGINQQQQEITLVATAVTELSSATQEISSNAEQTAQAAQESTNSTQNGREMVDHTRSSINSLAKELETAGEVVSDLNRHAQEISTVLSTIQGIAEQTNLLALNAAIEAARAGEQGRGFAVVADEVRVLSQRTHSSTEEIKSTIDTLQNTTTKAVSLMESSADLAGNSVDDADKATEALEEISQAVTLISDMATQIATAAEQQTHVTGEVTQNITLIKDVADQLVVNSEASSTSAGMVKSEVEALSQKVSTFKLA
jgi:methyl-accepting chemotaxis protein